MGPLEGPSKPSSSTQVLNHTWPWHELGRSLLGPSHALLILPASGGGHLALCVLFLSEPGLVVILAGSCQCGEFFSGPHSSMSVKHIDRPFCSLQSRSPSGDKSLVPVCHSPLQPRGHSYSYPEHRPLGSLPRLVPAGPRSLETSAEMKSTLP